MKRLILQTLIASLILLAFYRSSLAELVVTAIGLLALSTALSGIYALTAAYLPWDAIVSKLKGSKRT